MMIKKYIKDDGSIDLDKLEAKLHWSGFDRQHSSPIIQALIDQLRELQLPLLSNKAKEKVGLTKEMWVSLGTGSTDTQIRRFHESLQYEYDPEGTPTRDSGESNPCG